MSPVDMPFRQVHLDFHTSEEIDGIGADFDPEEFASTLQAAHVNSITCFARGHHGWIYYDTQRDPERRHPHLSRNLLREQIEACHAHGIRVPIYITVQWDHYTAERHPEWLCVGADGRIQGTPPFEAGFYRKLCVNSPYVDWLQGHVQEVLDTLPVDGLFFDIVQPNDCACAHCKAGMRAEGLDPADDDARRTYGLRIVNGFKYAMTEFVRRTNQDCTIFYNAGHIGPRHRAVADAYTHWELESLPSGGWGYLHFPLTMRYARTLGLDCLGMTGKFHTTWGDFHSFKNPEALQFECFTMLALNARCSVGDQLPPRGRICPHTYNLIGSVYKEVKAREAWCREAEPLVDIGVFSAEEFADGGHSRLPEPSLGAVRILQEGRQQFDFVDSASDLSRYRLLILPDSIPLSADLRTKLQAFLDAGGALIASHRAGLDDESKGFGVVCKGDAPFSPDFVVPAGPAAGAGLGQDLPATGHVVYLRGVELEPQPGAEVILTTEAPYFERTWEHFCSHNHTPSSGQAGVPGAVRQGRAIHFAHPLFTQYARRAPRWCKQLVLDAIAQLLPEPLLRVGGPSSITTAVNEQPAENRVVVHLLHYVPERRGQDFDTIEDVLPVQDVDVSLRVEGQVRAVVTAPEGDAVDFTVTGGRVDFTLPELRGYQIVVVERV